MSVETYVCPDKCCSIKIARVPPVSWRRGRCHKAGIFIFDPEEQRVLLVQSRGQLWGMPKGTVEIEKNETSLECALRETMEETGLIFKPEELLRATKVKNRAIYYYAERKSSEICIQKNPDEPANDANGITWIKLSCLYDYVSSGQIILNQHCRIVFKRFLDIRFPAVKFIKVKKKRSVVP